MGNLVKQAGIAFASLGLASAALAGSYSEGCDCEITIPKYAGGVRIGVEALYLAVDISNTEFAFSFQPQGNTNVFRSHNVSADSDWGYTIALAYVVAGTGNDFVVNWTDHTFNGSDSIALPGGNNNGSIHSMMLVEVGNMDDWSFGTRTPSVLSDASLSNAKGSYEVEYHKIDIEAGQAIKLGRDSVVLRFHAGLRYADLDTQFRILVDEVPVSTPLPNAQFSAESDFDGLGPRVGIDGAWHLGSNFALIAEASAALLVGDVSVSQRFQDSNGMSTPTLYNFEHRVSMDHVVVPNVEARLGVAYLHHFSNSSELNLEVGYHVTNYFDVDYKHSYSNREFSGSDVGMSGIYLKADYTI